MIMSLLMLACTGEPYSAMQSEYTMGKSVNDFLNFSLVKRVGKSRISPRSYFGTPIWETKTVVMQQ